MNVQKSVKVALAMAGENQQWLAKELGIKEGSLSGMLSNNNISSSGIERIARAFKIKPSALIALGE